MTVELSISAAAADVVAQAIMVTGSARSGTTIVGKLIHSFANVEYSYEPPTFFALFSLIDRMAEDQWRLMYETYLYEEFFINALAGRSINCNRSDDSSIYNVKDHAEIEGRLSGSLRKMEAQSRAASIVAFKMPDVVSRVPRLQDYYPGTRVVLVHRGCADTINSLMQKAWFSEENAMQNLTWPFTVHRGMQVPFWVDAADHDVWRDMSPVDRCAYYYLTVTRDAERIRNRIDVDYERMVTDPVGTAAALARRLGLAYGPRTQEIIDSIAPTGAVRDDGIMNKVDSRLRAEIEALTARPVAHVA